MCRLAAWASRTPTTLESVLGRDGLARLTHLSTVHSHGWGASWVDAAGEQQLFRSALAAHADPDFTRFAQETAGLAAIVHLRLGTPGYGSGLTNVHPFTDDEVAFAHNGAIMPPALIGRLQGAGSRRTPRSETDSERYFLTLRDEAERHDGSLGRAMDAVLDRMHEVGLRSSSLNAMMLDPTTLRVISCHDPQATVGKIPVWPVGSDVVWPAYFPLNHLDTPDLYAAASSGIVQTAAEGPWRILPNDQVWSIDLAELSSSSEPITQREEPADLSLRLRSA
jgi:predicted glutamine amidotransferase